MSALGKNASLRTAAWIPWSVVPAMLLTALLIATEWWSLLALALIGVLALTAPHVLRNGFLDRTGWSLWFGWTLMLVSSGVQHVTRFPIGYLFEGIIFILSVAVAFHVWKQAASDHALRALVILWIAYFAFCLLSTFTGRSHRWPALWQFQYNLKWPLMFGLGLMVAWGPKPARQLRYLLGYSWAALSFFVLLEIGAPSAHQALLGPPPDMHSNPLLGMGLRYRGPFSHSGYLALIGGLLCAASLAEFHSRGGRIWLVVSSLYFLLVLASGQRQEFLAVVLVVMLFATVSGLRYWHMLAGILAVAVILAVSSLGYFDRTPIYGLLAEWGLANGAAPLSERAILTISGVDIAREHFPLGSGLGTYGGVGAQKFDQSLFVEHGFLRYWWFRQGLFLVDTFWPNVIAESGFIGAALLCILFGVFWVTLLRNALAARGTANFGAALLGLGALTLVLANSPTSGALTDPRSSFLFWVLIGSSWSLCRPFDSTHSSSVPVAK